VPDPINDELDQILQQLAEGPKPYLLEESDRQAVLLAIAKLSIERPGWLVYLTETAAKLGPTGVADFEKFRELSTKGAPRAE
jgi:hypothetical protein